MYEYCEDEYHVRNDWREQPTADEPEELAIPDNLESAADLSVRSVRHLARVLPCHERNGEMLWFLSGDRQIGIHASFHLCPP